MILSCGSRVTRLDWVGRLGSRAGSVCVLGFCARTPLTLVRGLLRLGRLGGTASRFAGTGGFSCHLFCVWLGFPRVFDLVLILFTAPLLSGFCRNPVWRSKRTAA